MFVTFSPLACLYIVEDMQDNISLTAEEEAWATARDDEIAQLAALAFIPDCGRIPPMRKE